MTYSGGSFHEGLPLSCDNVGNITAVAANPPAENAVRLDDRALLPGLINAHSHAFQRVIRGRTEYRTSYEKDSFWTWREKMYSAGARLTPEDVYDASRMTFLEMALSGITCVGEFHYLHHAPDGSAYDDPNLLATEVVRAANDVGLRIALLRVAYARSGFQTEPNTQQARFIEKDSEVFLKNAEQLASSLGKNTDGAASPMAWVGVAPHSVRAVPLNYLKAVVAFANERRWPVHMHVAEQPAEVSACIEEYGRSPVALMATEGLLSERFTGVHVIHVTPKAVRQLADANAQVCACPTTERNLGDGIIPVDEMFKQGVRVSLGSDSQVQIDLLEDARELEYHLRLQKWERLVLDQGEGSTTSSLAARLFECATVNGAASLNAPGGILEAGHAADFFTVDLNDPSIAGASADDLLSSLVFSLSKSAVRDVVVNGKQIVTDGKHAQQEDIIQRFKALQQKLWG